MFHRRYLLFLTKISILKVNILLLLEYVTCIVICKKQKSLLVKHSLHTGKFLYENLLDILISVIP